MKSIFSVLLTLIALSAMCQVDDNFSQNNNKQDMRAHIALRFGASLPQGDFKSTSFAEPKAGFAKTGISAGVQLIVPATQGLGFTIDYYGASHKLDVVAFENVIYSNLPGLIWEAESNGRYDNKNLMFGIHLSAGEDVKFFFNPEMGLSWLNMPSIKLTGMNFSSKQSASTLQTFQRSRVFAYSLGAGFSLNVSPNTVFFGEGRYVVADHELETNIRLTNPNGSVDNFGGLDQPIDYRAINVTIGFAFKVDLRGN